jgi:signal transduction histidine kinase/ligand-binding sensor domain-containing protein/DNA-binding response OmpR family regulator
LLKTMRVNAHLRFVHCWAICTVLMCLLYPQSVMASILVNPGPVVEKIEKIAGQTPKGIKTLIQDQSGFMWLATNEGLLRFDGHSVKRFVHDDNNPKSLAHNDIRGIVEDQNGYLWLITRGGGLSRFTLKTEQFDNFAHVQGDTTTLDSNQLNTIALGDGNTLWIGSNQGINHFDRTTLKNSRFNSALQPGDDAVRENIDKIFEDKQQRLWFSQRRKGLYLHMPQSQKTLHFQHDAADTRSLDANMVSAIYQSSDDNIWIGTSVSINRFNAAAFNFDRFAIPLKENNKVNHASVTRIFEDANNNIWIGTFYNGVSLLKADSHNIVNLNQPSKLKDSFDALHINDIFQDRSGILWFVTPRRGLVKLNPAAMNFAHRLVKTKSATITAMLADSKGVLWLATQNHLYSQQPDSQNFELTAQNIGLIQHLYESESHHIAFHDKDGGFVSFDPQTKLTAQYSGEFTDASPVIPTSIPTVAAGTVKVSIADKQGLLWLGTTAGLVRFDPTTNKTTTFGPQQGLRLSTITMGALLPSGDIVMAGSAGLVRFSPQKLNVLSADSTVQGTIMLSDFKLFSQSVPLQSQDANSPLVTTINKTDAITLSYQQNWFSIAFASSFYQQGEKQRYAFKMQGLSEQWIETDGTNRIANFTSIAPGEYVFKVKVAKPDGRWHDNIRSLNISITPPWWQTKLAYFLYIVAALTLIFLFNSLRTRQLRQRAARLEKGIEERTIELRQRADTIAVLLEDKDRLIANISHEFRTPLTLILGPLASQIKAASNEQSQAQLSLAQANAHRLLAMVDQLLDMARLKDLPSSSKQRKDVVKTCHFLVGSFKPLAQNRDIDLRFDLAGDSNLTDAIHVNMQPDALEKILSNLLTNAFKYSGDNTQITLIVTAKSQALVEVSVKDTGQGISESDQKQIFKRFIRLKNSAAYVPGAGIGLALVKDLVEQHEGTITVHSVIGQGSTFTVALPISSSSESDSEVNEAVVISAVEQVNSSQREQLIVIGPSENEIDDSDKINILVIEDNQDMRQYIVSCLGERYLCAQAGDGEEGVEMARKNLPDLIISDVMMPKMDGFEVTQTLKNDQATSHIPIILLTARGDSDSRMKGWSQRADEFLEKPFNTTELLARIDNLLAIRRLLQVRFQGEFSKLEAVIEKNAAQIEAPEPITEQASEQDQEQDQEQAPPVNLVHQAFVDQANQVLEKHYGDEAFDVSRFASEMALSSRQLGRKLKALLDMTPAEAMRNFRLKKAAEQLSQGASPSVVSHKVGFGTHSYFTQCFKAKYGCNPSDYLKG